MTEKEINERITVLQHELAAIQVQNYAVGAAGGVAGVIYASKKGKSFLGKVGYFMAGSFIGSLPMQLLRSKRMAELMAEIKNLQAQLPAQQGKSLFDSLQEQLANNKPKLKL